MRCCYPEPGVVTVIGVIPDNSVSEIMFLYSYSSPSYLYVKHRNGFIRSVTLFRQCLSRACLLYA